MKHAPLRLAALCVAALVLGCSSDTVAPSASPAGAGGAAASVSTSGVGPGGSGVASSGATGPMAAAGSGGSTSSSGAGGGAGGSGGAGAPETSAGAGKTSYTCPTGAIVVAATDDAAATTSKLNGAASGATVCINGRHRVTASILPKAGQTLVGIGADAGLSGAVALTAWKPDDTHPGIFYYDGAYAQDPSLPHVGDVNFTPCYAFSSYQDDVFFDDRRMLRVLDVSQLGDGAPLPQGQATDDVEYGRFYFDYVNHRIYVDRDPTGHAVELAYLDALVQAISGGDDVTVENLVLEKARTAIVDFKASGGPKSWTITDTTIRFAHNSGILGGSGSSSADPFHLVRVFITQNGQFAIGAGGNWTTLEDCEISWNNLANYRIANGTTCGGYWGAGAVKFVYTLGTATTPGLHVVNLDSHHNVGDGFWTDVHNRFVKIEGGRLHDNERNGYFHEIGCDIEMTNIELDHNGARAIKNPDWVGQGAGVVVSDSNNADIHGNVVHDNGRGIILQYQQSHTGMLPANPANQCPPAANDTDTSQSDMNNAVHDNAVYMASGTSGTNAGPTLASRGNTFANNAYHVPDVVGKWWTDSTAMTWSAWTQAGHDASGSAVAPGTYP